MTALAEWMTDITRCVIFLEWAVGLEFIALVAIAIVLVAACNASKPSKIPSVFDDLKKD